MSNENPTPAVMPRKVDPIKRRGRAYGLGERNPDTLPGSGKNAETEDQNRQATARWKRLGKLAKAGRL